MFGISRVLNKPLLMRIAITRKFVIKVKTVEFSFNFTSILKASSFLDLLFLDNGL